MDGGKMGNIVLNMNGQKIRVIAWQDKVDIDILKERFLVEKTIRMDKKIAIKVAKYILEEYC